MAALGVSLEFRASPAEQGSIEFIFSSELKWKGYIIEEKY